MKQFVYDLPISPANIARPEQDFGQFETELGDYLGAVASDTWNNGTTLGSFTRRSEAMGTYTDALDLFGGDTQSVSIDTSGVNWEAPMPLEEQKALIKSNGMEGKISPYFVEGTNGTQNAGYTRETLDLLMQFRKDDETNAMLRENASNWYAPLGVVAMIGTSMLDVPGMLMTIGNPVLGQARALSMLRATNGAAWGRFGVRALEGAIAGGSAMAMLEPVIVNNRKMWNDEWSPMESVLNIGMGAIIGAGLHSAFGAFGDRMRRKSGQRQPWQILNPDAESERLRIEFRDGIIDTIRKASENVKGILPVSENVSEGVINAVSGQFDVIARTLAYDLNKPLSEVYASFAPTFEAVKNIADVGSMGFAKAVEIAGEQVLRKNAEIAINEVGKAAIKLFGGTTGDDVERAFFSGYRLLMEQIAKNPEARESARVAYGQIERFVNAEPGKAWTPAQERRFQDAGMLFLRNKNAVPAEMEVAFEGMNQFMREMKLQAENTGVEIPRWLDDRLETLQSSIEERDAEFSRRVVELADDRDLVPERQGIDTIDGLTELEAEGATELESLRRATENADKEIERADLISEEVRENLRSQGFSEDVIDMLIDKNVLDEAIIAQEKAIGYERLMKETSKDEAMAALECEIRKALGI